MKKILALLILSVALVSCYEDYVKDFNYSSIYFPYQVNVRSLIVGEGMKIEIGADLGGVMKNTIDRNVDFILDNSLINSQILQQMKNGAVYIKTAVAGVTDLLPLPTSYYTLSNNSRMVIKAGQHMGSVVLKVDSAVFLADAVTLNPVYAIPLYITAADADTILESKRFAVIGVKYENMLFGNYYHGGLTVEKDATGNVVNTQRYYTVIPQAEGNIWRLTTVAPNKLTVPNYSGTLSNKAEIMLTLNGSDIIIESAPDATFVFQAEGKSTFNRSKLLQDRKIYLNYKYVNSSGNTCYATDTLTFRNRIRDGVNEWQDDNPSHY